MKKLLFAACFSMLAFAANATHMMGGQITSKNIGGLTYEIINTVYRDVTGIPISATRDFNIQEVGGSAVVMSAPHNGAVNIGNGVEEYVYTLVYTFPNPGNYTIWIEECCRNEAILNMAAPGSETFHLYNELWVHASNSSPVFLNPPIPVAQLNNPFNYNPMPFDADGDSLTWELDTPLTANGAYVTGFTLPSADPAGPFTMNSVTGEVSFLPNLEGHFEASFIVSEYRNGTKIGEIRRDMQIIVLPSPNTPPVIVSTSNTYPYSGKVYSIAPGNNLNFSVAAIDPDANPIDMTAIGEPLLMSSNPASFVTSIPVSGQVTGTFSWTPTAAQARPLPYIVSLRLIDNYATNTFQNDISFSIGVGNFTALNDVSGNAIKSIYPNPNSGNFTLELNAAKTENASIAISNMLGQELHTMDYQMKEGVNLINIRQSGLPKGNYIVTISVNGKITGNQRFEIKD